MKPELKEIQKLSKRLKTPKQVQAYLRKMPYNRGNTLHSAFSCLKHQTGHCFETAMLAAAVLEFHGYPPLVMSLESIDGLDHVLFVFKEKGRWGAIGRSRDEGLHGRAPVFRTLKDLARSYYDPYVDESCCVTGFQVAHMDETKCDWRGSRRNVWKAERYLIDLPHQKLKFSKSRYRRVRAAFDRRGHPPPEPYWW